MAFQIETGSGSDRATNYRDMLGKLTRFLCSQHVATVAVNAGGTGYVVGDEVTLTHGSAHLDAVFEVTSVSSGVITGLRINSSGAFAQQASSATITAGGTGYQVGDLLQVSGGSSRLPAKARVTTVSAGAVTAVSFAEATAGDGAEPGVYGTTPSNAAATVGVGNITSGTTYAGGDDCTLTITYQAIIGTTGLSVTGGTGSGATVNITLAETGWTVDERDVHNITVNSITNERLVVLKGDATGQTNKPFIAYMTGTATSGLNTRHAIATFGLIAHNPSLAFDTITGVSPNWNGSSLQDGGAYILMPQDTGSGTDEIDFWISADDMRALLIPQINESAAASDDGIYIQHHAGLLDRIGTESESPYPNFVFGSSRQVNVDPTSASNSITGIAENRHTGEGCGFYYDTTTDQWRDIQNDDTVGTPGLEEEVMLPIGRPRLNDNTGSDDFVVRDGDITVQSQFFELDRSSASRVLRKVPGTADQFFLWPLTVARKQTGTPTPSEDIHVGQVRGVYWISSDNGSGARISDFSEDFVTISGTRYLIFHNHVHTEPYQYVAVEWDT